MKAARIPNNETDRLAALNSYNILDSVEEQDFDEIVALASEICNTPISLISLIDEGRQWFKAKVGLNVSETKRDIAFCSHAILDSEILEIEDTLKDNRFIDNPLVTGDPKIRFYAGMPLKSTSGYNIGTLCVIDNKPNKLSDFQKTALKTLSNHVVRELELRRINKQLQLNQEELKRTSAFKDKLLSIMSHDVRSPLNSLFSTIEMSEQGFLTDFDKTNIKNNLLKEIKNVNDLLDNILNWSKMQLEGKNIKNQYFETKAIVEETLSLLNSQLKNKEISIQNNCDRQVLNADKESIKMVIRNLIHNAIKFSKAGGQITIETNETEMDKIICISDTGVGMTKDQVDNLTNGKNVESQIGTEKEKGVGLGFLLCQEFVAAHEGKITIESELNKGSKFCILLPKSLH